MIRRLGYAAFAAAALLPAAAHAVTAQGNLMMKRWEQSDKCAQTAQRLFPDYTADALAKRDQAYKNCLNASGLPPRELPAPGQP
jgi:hypothetical protein